MRAASDDLQHYLRDPQWYQRQMSGSELPRAIAYFSPEFGITSVLPQDRAASASWRVTT